MYKFALLLSLLYMPTVLSYRTRGISYKPRPYAFDEYLERTLKGEKFSEDDFNIEPPSSSYLRHHRVTMPRVSSYGRLRIQPADTESYSDENQPAGKDENSLAADSAGLLRHSGRFQSSASARRFAAGNRFSRFHHQPSYNFETGSGSGSEDDTEAGDVSESEVIDAVYKSTKPNRRYKRKTESFQALEEAEYELQGVPREHWGCCTLGMLAGDKGFACESRWYRRRILDRNANRVHNRRLSGIYFDNLAPTETGMKLMISFSNCVTGSRATRFDYCCNLALTDYTARTTRWDRFHRDISQVAARR